MICRYSKPGCDEVLEQVQRLCLQLLYERQALKISICADHGHNFMLSTNVQFDDALKSAGFHITSSVRGSRDVAIDRDGLVTYLGIHTKLPAEVAEVVLTRPEVELVTYLQQDRVIVRDHDGSAAIEFHDGKYKYSFTNSDVLKLGPILDELRHENKVDGDGFVADQDWFNATVDADFPDSPHRLWEAFHGLCISPPDVMLTMRDGYCSGHTTLEKLFTMASSHGGLNQVNSATFLMTMTGRAHSAMRSENILPTVAPGYVIPIRTER